MDFYLNKEKKVEGEYEGGERRKDAGRERRRGRTGLF